ncbi:serine/threonine protein kinase [Nocardia yunnanensis]|uniref:non-specific serine/threonine protein kinase n=2 Tax=Nocardia yunnanensis TaxID=2382165 RepID=A0A386ZQ33_9NOCA|nr:serine/threonine protein kinase [Nocardia yunnanensis]
MGEVYLARDRDLPRSVALKLLAAGKADDAEVRARFLREADTAARLSHPNIVAVYARGDDEHRLWMAMQYVEGTDVSAVLRDGPIRPDHAVRILGETARALDHAHRAGVLHRDVKPANILLAWGPEQRVYLADFGIAKAVDHTSALTRTGEMYASFQYAAPEQFELRGDIDHRADVYALGCTLFHMLTARLPYPGETTAQLVAAHLAAEIPRPSRIDPTVPAAFDQVIQRALAKNRDERFGSCGELAAAAAQALTAATGTGGPWSPGGGPACPISGPLHPVASPARPDLDLGRFTGATTKPSIPIQPGPSGAPPGRPLRYPGVTGDAPRPVDLASSEPAPATAARSARGGRKALIAAFVAALVVAGGLGLGFGTGAIHFGSRPSSLAAPPVAASSDTTAPPGDASQDAATKAACAYGVLMNTYDYGNGDAWQTKVEDGATGAWKSQAQTLIPTIRPLLELGTHTRSTGGKCTVTSGGGTHYELSGVFDLVDTVNGKDANQRTQTIPLGMDYVDGRWLCGKLAIPGLTG